MVKYDQLRSTTVTNAEAQASRGGKNEAQAGLGVAKTKVRGCIGVDLGSVRGTLGRFWEVQGGQGRAPEKFRGRFVCFFNFWAKK